jgi:acyl transferase domain-containing protein/NAD(P)-dependent dehydrogenase (short-subunit alcohol dehydrogenase family)
MDNSDVKDFAGYGIAIVGMANRVPGAKNPEEFWHNLENGIESVNFYSDEEMVEAGVTPDLLKNPNYVKAGAHLDKFDYFDPDFFGFSPKEAGILDPQHRQFYECCWEALERAGHPPSKFDGAIGVYAGSGMAAYLAQNIMTNKDLVDSVGMFLLRHTGNDKDFLATRVSYSFNLKGPSVNVQNACSTSSVATHMACQALLTEECDMALAGGVTIDLPHSRGYLYKENEILSPDGHCRAFDHRSKGTIFGSGTGVVVLRRLEDAIRDGDYIHAVITGSAINNDGSSKVGYLAPSVEGQAEAITEALEIADIDSDTIEYVECHGTGTPVGDPIEVAALTAAFNETTKRKGFCGLGSVKTNIGHLDTAAGVAGIIKASLALENRKIPASLNYEAPNPTIDFSNSPFYVNDKLKEWKAGDNPRRAAVNSLGVGGTNAFIILEEAPERTSSSPYGRTHHLLTFSAKSRKSLDLYGEKLATFLAENPEIDMADAAYTLFEGREKFDNRRILAVRDREEAIEVLKNNDQRRVYTHSDDGGDKSLVFMFPGGGAQYINMGLGLYETESIFKEYMDEGFKILQEKTKCDYKSYIFLGEQNSKTLALEMEKPSVQLPLIFLVEYALAKLWMSMGVEPKALIGHSMGENTAACLAGVFSFPDALGLVLLRGQLMDDVPEGGMLSVQLPLEKLKKHLHDKLAIAAINSPMLSVVSGTKADLSELSNSLNALDIENKTIPIDIAAHSWLLDDILEPFGNYLNGISLNKPQIDFISNYTGTWITDEEATDPQYWVKHLRNTIKFADGINTLLNEDGRIFLEVGPGNILGSLTRQNSDAPAQRVFSTLRHRQEETADDCYFYTVLGRLWSVGLKITAEQIWGNEIRHRIPMPSYAFNHNQYFIEPGQPSQETNQVFTAIEKINNISDWYSKPVWVQQGVLAKPTQKQNWLVFLDDSGIGQQLTDKLRNDGHIVVTVEEGDAYYQLSQERYKLSPESGLEAYNALVNDLLASGHFPDCILHLWLLTQDESFRPGSSFLHRNQEHGFYSLFFFARAMADDGLVDRKLDMLVYANGMMQVAEEKVPYPEKSTVIGSCKMIPREFPNVKIACFDVSLDNKSKSTGIFSGKKEILEISAELIRLMSVELYAPIQNGLFAYRDNVRWQRLYDRLDNTITKPDAIENRLRQEGVYLITGGLGGIGYTLAKELAKSHNAKLVLINRTPLPERSEWADWLHKHGHDDKISLGISKVRKLEELGADVLVLSGDVTDVDRMQESVNEAEAKYGVINGVIHGAGTINDALIQMKNQGDIEEVFAPKVYGTLVLDEIFKDKNLDFFVLFSSTSTAIAPVGQIDYVAANCFLNAFAQYRNTSQSGYTVAVNWGVWNEVGMAASSAAKMGYGSPSPVKEETADARYQLFDKHIQTSKNGRDVHYLTSYYNSKQQWVLDEHRTKKGQALLPGTAYIELARAALNECGETGSFELKELIFLKALYVPENKTIKARVKLEQTVEGYDFAIQSEAVNTQGEQGWQTHAEARIIIGIDETKETDEIFEVMSRLGLNKASDSSLPAQITMQEEHLNFGPRWSVLRDAKYAEQESVATLSLDDKYESDIENFKIHPALLDIATGYAMALIEGYAAGGHAENLWVPVSYGSFKYYKPLTQHIYSWVRNNNSNKVEDDFANFDISLYDLKGNLVAEVHKLTIRKMVGEVDFSLPDNKQIIEIDNSVNSVSGSDFRSLSPAEMAFQHNLSQGILPAEGAQALYTILEKCNESEVIISSLEIESLIKEVDATAASMHKEDDDTKFARPDLDSEYVEPRDDIEKTLVGFWEELLGVDQVGIEDSFFDLGGHSLVAVRLFSKIQQTYNVDYPISILFEAPTISACADMLREVVGDGANSTEESKSQDKSPKSRYTHLVPMHTTKSTQLTPFFLVAGMFGNVLNLRHLAQLIGNDRPFYGLQARGLYGDHEPHSTFEEMAVDYIKEMKTVQPEGPYILGGFSGGGITAYEIARQLKEAGEQVAELIFLDTPLPYNEPISSVDRMSIHWQRLQNKGLSYFTEWAKSRYQWELHKYRKRFGEIENERETPAEFKSGVLEIAFYNALSRYNIQPLDINAKLFRPKLPVKYHLKGGRVANEDRQVIQEDNGWPQYVNKLSVFEVPGNHDSMVLEPNVRVLATKLGECINNADPKMKNK